MGNKKFLSLIFLSILFHSSNANGEYSSHELFSELKKFEQNDLEIANTLPTLLNILKISERFYNVTSHLLSLQSRINKTIENNVELFIKNQSEERNFLLKKISSSLNDLLIMIEKNSENLEAFDLLFKNFQEKETEWLTNFQKESIELTKQ